MKARKRPVEVEAWLFNRSEAEEQRNKYPMVVDVSTLTTAPGVIEREDRFLIMTLEGSMIVMDGDYIIKGVNGEFYPCKPDIFKKTYDIIGK